MSETLVSARNGDAAIVQDVPAASYQLAPDTEPGLDSATPRRLAWRALLLDQRAYTTVVTQASPLKTGFLTLLLILGVVVVARLIGWALGYLTSPRLDSLQTLLQNFITGLPWYQAQAQQSPQFVPQFTQSYWLSWEGVRLALGIPTPLNQGITIGALVLDTLGVWLVFATLAHWLARWFGGAGSWKQTLGAAALAYAPLLLLVVEAVPGAYVPLALLFLAMLVGKYQAIKSAHGLAPGYTLASILLPYLIGVVVLLALMLFGGAYGLDQIPYVDTGLRTFNMFSGLLR